MNKTIVSTKWELIWQDIKSWAITTALLVGPVALVSLVEVLMKQDYGDYTQVAMVILGSLLKLIQKLSSRSYYESN